MAEPSRASAMDCEALVTKARRRRSGGGPAKAALGLKLAKEFAGGSRQLGLEPFARLWRSREERIRAPSLTLGLRNWPVGRVDRFFFPRDSQARQNRMACRGGETCQLLLHGSDIGQ
jgi:hypothetical protein